MPFLEKDLGRTSIFGSDNTDMHWSGSIRGGRCGLKSAEKLDLKLRQNKQDAPALLVNQENIVIHAQYSGVWQ